MFATAEDVETRLGRELTEQQQDAAEFVSELVTDLICEVAGINEPDENVPAYYRALCVEKAVAAISNPENLSSMSRSLGSFSQSSTFQRISVRDTSGISLTEFEERKIRQIASGRASGSSRPRSAPDDFVA